ncbi:tRNA adenosine(34) deaminase TadA [Echinimonas agarilytica]|uniref:tRNA-specific adenosine deaminase n=1 Tax=Echinimonas agarilytica TaxID=1215918 RepID=A0AA42B8E3_9GAMM|nr:tRNA adenosine(34) deaminase TadA [Echinimonas agarilytica]MCM2680111.1 tRNA adenosine(34) deaminase TadA [Echinimonas agarilytica]
MKSDVEWMQYARALAEKAEALGEVPVGAVLVSAEGDLIAEGFNQSICNHDPTAHAEIMAIRNAGQALENYRLVDTTMYVTLEPCPMCAGAMVHARVGRLVFGAPDPRTGAAGTVFQLVQAEQLNHQMEVLSGVSEQECAEQLRLFFRKKRQASKALKLAAKSEGSVSES